MGLATDTYEAGHLPFALDGARWHALEQQCARLGTTPFVALASAFLVLLARWGERDDVCVLSADVHRNRPGSETIVGNFVTPYPLRVAFTPADSLEAAVRRCHASVVDRREHTQVAPTSAIPAWPAWSRYNVNYLIEPTEEPLDFGAATAERLDWNVLARRTAHDLAVFLRQSVRGVHGTFVYNTERFSAALATRAVARLGALIDGIAREPGRTLRDLPTVP